jgi:hypothetical protein
MKFEATVVEKKSKFKAMKKMPFKRQTKDMEAAYPVKRIDMDGMVTATVRTKAGFRHKEYSYYLAVTPYDLTNLTTDELDDIQTNYGSFQKSYRAPFKEVFLSFPENNAEQQDYIQKLMANELDNFKLALLEKELQKLRFLEEAHIAYKSFIQIFGSTPQELQENFAEFQRSAKAIFPSVEKLGRVDTRLLLSLYNNGTQAVKRKASRLAPQSDKMDVALSSPQGGLVFDFPNYYVQGARYRSVITIEGKPSLMPTWWTSHITSRAESDMVTIDHDFDTKYDPIPSIDSTITSYDKLITDTTKPTDIQKYRDEQGYLLGLSSRLREEGEIMKMVRIRVHVSGYSEEGLGTKVQKLIRDLYSKNFPATIIVNNTKRDYQSFFMSYKLQRAVDDNVMIGLLRLPTEAIAEGFNHNNISLEDEMGFYIGQSLTGGSIYYSNFTKTGKRLSYSIFVSGVQGGGKSAMLKKLIKNHFEAGGYNFGFDVNGEYYELVRYLRGSYLPLDGRAGILNMLQVFPFVTVEAEESMEIDIEGSFESHLDSLVDRLRAIRNYDDDVASDIRGVLLEFYVSFGLWRNPNVSDITALDNTAYPTFKDLHAYLNERVNTPMIRERMDSDLLRAHETLLKITRQAMTQYEKLLVGHTTLDKNVNNETVFFDISRLKNGTANVYDAVFQTALSFVLGLANKYGRAEKRAYDKGEKSWNEISRVLITVDESHNILNPEKYYNVSAFDILAREARKFFIAYVLGTQLIEAMLPEKLSNNLSDTATFAMNKLSNIIGLTQYKIFAKQSSTSMPTLKKYFAEDLKPRDYKEMLKYDISDKGSRLKMIISGDKTIDFYGRLSTEEIALFRGGA